MSITSDYVMVPVPAKHMTKVYGFIASLEEPDVRATADSDGWTPDLLKRQYAESSDTMKRLQKHLAAHADEKFMGDELADAIGLDYGWNSIAGAVGAYTRRIKNHYRQTEWPFDFAPDTDGVWKYSMRSEVADIIDAL